MDIDSGAPYYRAVVLAHPQISADGSVCVRVCYRGKKAFVAHGLPHMQKVLLSVRQGDELYVCSFDGDICSVIKHNVLMRWFTLFIYN